MKYILIVVMGYTYLTSSAQTTSDSIPTIKPESTDTASVVRPSSPANENMPVVSPDRIPPQTPAVSPHHPPSASPRNNNGSMKRKKKQ